VLLQSFRECSTNREPPAMKSVIRGSFLVHLDFVLTGVVMALLGPMLPALSARWALNDAQAGYLFTAQFVASMVGMLLSGVLVRRYGYRLTLVCGLALMALGMLLLAGSDWTLGLVSVCIFGSGFGVTTPAANLLVARMNPTNAAAPLSLLNSAWGVGAMSCPLLVAVAQRSERISFFLYGMALALAALGTALCFVRFAYDESGLASHPVATGEISTVTVRSWSKGSVPIIAALFFVYVGTETCMGGWMAAYARRLDSGSREFWAVTPSFFWGALLLGRFLAPLVLRHVREIRLAAAGVALAAFGILVLLAAKTIMFVTVGASLTGLGLASVYPINVSLLSHWFGEMSTRVSGVVFALGSLGGGILPWLVGVLSTRFGSLRVGFIVPWLGAMAMLAFYLANRPRPRGVTEAS
jgi:MFS transporter, FHS family, glucose/mannose:H+ symporter